MICKPPPPTQTPATGSITMSMLAGSARPESNLLSNPGFNFAQQQIPGTLTTIPDNTYGPDCWKVTRSAADVQYQRLANAGIGSYISANRGRFKKITNPGRIVVFQALENLVTLGLAQQQVNFQINIGFNVNRNWRIAVINYSGAADALTSMISDFTTSPMTLAANYAYLFSFTVNTTAASILDIGVTVPNGGISNLILAVMVEDSMAVNDTMDLTEAHCNITANTRDSWYPLLGADDLARVERFFEKSYDTDVPSATVTTASAKNFSAVGTSHIEEIRFRQRKPKAPNVTLFSSTGASGNFRDLTAAADRVAAAQNIGLAGCGVALTASVNTNQMAGHFTADSQL